MSEPSFSALEPSDLTALDAFFERCDAGCHCRYWHFTGDKNAWLARCAHAPADNAREFREAFETGSGMQGVVARAEGEIWGWLKLSAAEEMTKLYDQRLYRGLPCFNGDRSGTYTVGCVLVDPERRRRGLAHGLLQAGIELCRKAGARRIEAFPRRAELVSDGELWLGPYSIFERAGFQAVNDFQPYPVMRLEF